MFRVGPGAITVAAGSKDITMHADLATLRMYASPAGSTIDWNIFGTRILTVDCQVSGQNAPTG
jgi:hypothetical protein